MIEPVLTKLNPVTDLKSAPEKIVRKNLVSVCRAAVSVPSEIEQ